MWSGTMKDIEVGVGDAVGEEEAAGFSVGGGCVVCIGAESGGSGVAVVAEVDVDSGV
jgi:hypothetical protein